MPISKFLIVSCTCTLNGYSIGFNIYRNPCAKWAHIGKNRCCKKAVKNNNLIEFSTFYCQKKSNCVFTDHIIISNIIIICCWYQSWRSVSHLGRLNGDDNNNKDILVLMSNQISSIWRVRVCACTCRRKKTKANTVSLEDVLPFCVRESELPKVRVCRRKSSCRILWKCHFFNVFQHYVFVV